MIIRSLRGWNMAGSCYYYPAGERDELGNVVRLVVRNRVISNDDEGNPVVSFNVRRTRGPADIDDVFGVLGGGFVSAATQFLNRDTNTFEVFPLPEGAGPATAAGAITTGQYLVLATCATLPDSTASDAEWEAWLGRNQYKWGGVIGTSTLTTGQKAIGYAMEYADEGDIFWAYYKRFTGLTTVLPIGLTVGSVTPDP